MESVETSETQALAGDTEPGETDTTFNPETQSQSENDLKVQKALENWAKELGEYCGPSPLEDIEALGEEILDLTTAHPGGLAQLLSGKDTRLSSLLREEKTMARARRLARTILRKTESQNHYAMPSIYLAAGVASWTQMVDHAPLDLRGEKKSFPGRPHYFQIPVLLRAVTMRLEGEELFIQADPALSFNPFLKQVFTARSIDYNFEKSLQASGQDNFKSSQILAELRSLGSQHLVGFDLRDQYLVGAFQSPEQIVVQDFKAWRKNAAKHPIVRALAGDEEEIKRLEISLNQDPHDREPDLERGVGDLDPKQLDAVEAVASGANVLISTPPGSCGADTISAIMADGAASGKNVWYIPGTTRLAKRATRNLQNLRLEELVVDLGQAKNWNQNLCAILRRSLDPPQVDFDYDAIEDIRDRLRDVRHKLATYSDKLHIVRQPWGVSVYEALQALADLTSAKPGPRTKVRLVLNTGENSSIASREQARELFKEAQSLGILDAHYQDSAWRSAVLSTKESAAAAIERVMRLNSGILGKMSTQIMSACEATGLVAATTVESWLEQLNMIDGVREVLDVFKPEVFEHSAADMVIATASKKWRIERSLPMKFSKRRQLLRQARDLLRPGVSVDDIHQRLVQVQEHREVWSRYAQPGAWPRVPDELDEMLETAHQVRQDLVDLAPVLSGKKLDIFKLSLTELENLIAALARDTKLALRLPAELALLKRMSEHNLDELLADLKQRRVSADLALAELDLAWWAAVLSGILASDQIFAGYDGQALRQLANSLRELDVAHCQTLPDPVRKAVFDQVKTVLNENSADGALAVKLYNDLDPARGINIEKLLRDYPVIWRIRPIWILPPVLASALGSNSEIDLLILDHLDQIPLAQVVALIARARQVVVVGDPLRPWQGITRRVAKILPTITLPTINAQLSEQVAAFLASHGYGHQLQAVPSPQPASQVRLEVVDSRRAPASSGISEPGEEEINRVLELVLEHALGSPEKSLAVICINPLAVEKIRKAVEEAIRSNPVLKAFFSAKRPEAFIVVDSNGAPGLHRDKVILCIGFPKTPHGRVIHDFPPVSSPCGVAHLVTCLEVVRRELAIVSAFSAAEMDKEKMGSAGTKMLCDLLEQAGRNRGMARALVTPASFEAEPDRLLVDLAERLWRKGFTVVPRFGLPGAVRVPLAIGHADLPSELLVAVLSDDEDYAKEPSLRRRERYWPARLEAAGWKVVSVYSTEVFANPQAQAQIVAQAVETALAERKAQLARPPVDIHAFIEKMRKNALFLEKQRADKIETVSDTSPQLAQSPASGEDLSAQNLDSASPALAEVSSAPDLQLVPPPRGPRPPVAKGLPLAAYGDDQLDEMLHWVCSDGVFRSEDQQVEELRQALAIARRGAQVDAVLRHVVRRRAAIE